MLLKRSRSEALKQADKIFSMKKKKKSLESEFQN
jgi:hypothetical protein